MQQRIKRLFANCSSEIQAIVVKNASAPYIDDNFFYLSGLQHGLFEGSIAIAHHDGHLDLIISQLEAETAKKANATFHIYKTEKEQHTLLTKHLSAIEKIGINTQALTAYDYQQLKKILTKKTLIDVSSSFHQTRLIKEQQEIKQIQKACKISDEVIQKIPSMLQEKMTESQLAAEINYQLQQLGAEKPAFDTISSFAANTAEPHYIHGLTQLKKNVFVLCDFGACYQKYNADITRTFVYGTATKKQKEIYEIVAEAQKAGIDAIKPGVTGETIHQIVTNVIDKTNYKGRFIHNTGHTLGLAVHDGPNGLGPQSKVKLKNNMIFTVEPGIYIPKFGGVRIEDTVLVTSKGAQRLTTSTRSLLEINIKKENSEP